MHPSILRHFEPSPPLAPNVRQRQDNACCTTAYIHASVTTCCLVLALLTLLVTFLRDYNNCLKGIMEAAPPSYEKATLVDIWDIVAHYIPPGDLCSAALVCKRWHSACAPHLWGNPASFFGVENDQVYIALAAFKRTLRIARPSVRVLTHTLHLPPAHPELYNGPSAEWLRDILDRLPNLQSLVVRGLPFFDYSALQALKHQPHNTNYSFNLRLLDASRCQNLTASSLTEALERFQSLLYLDLSFTRAARNPDILSALRILRGLQVLKLRGINMNDESIDVLAPAIGRRVRSLDIRDNQVGDEGVRRLLSKCCLPSNIARNQVGLSLLPALGRDMLEIYQGENFESYLRQLFTEDFVGHLAIENATETGISHLYACGNNITVDGASDLAISGQLHALDLRAVRPRRALSSAPPAYEEVEKHGLDQNVGGMTSALLSGAKTIHFLRIFHQQVTANTSHAESRSSNLPSDQSNSVEEQRKARIRAHHVISNTLHPAMLPHVRTLVLTDVPPKSSTHDTANRLIQFIRQCATESSVARTGAKQDYALPPGRKGRAAALQASADNIFALKRLILEMAPPPEQLERSGKASQWNQSTKSMTEDRDSEVLWSAAETDFTFFGEDEGSNYPSIEPQRSGELYNSDEKKSKDRTLAEAGAVSKFDTISLLSAFRKDRKLAHQRNIDAGERYGETEGYWDGMVQVVRPDHRLRIDEQIDYYGTRFDYGTVYK